MFAEAVTEAIAPGYFAIIRRPMDFRTVRDNVHRGNHYDTWVGWRRLNLSNPS